MNVKIDQNGRITIPIALREMLQVEDSCYLYLSGDGQRLYITKEQNYTLDEIIRKRLKNKQLSNDERNFLEKLRRNL